ncbi:MAG: hypothetical protein MUO34_14825 [Ignavibacteriaceae bacterium]|nr:hypothetical protein [Ignavibacteriaceae bacterium]
MVDTLRYFFSAVFQGFAALVTLGSMFYISYFDKIDTKKKRISEEASRQYHPDDEGKLEILKSGIIPVIKKDLLPKIEKDKKRYFYYSGLVSQFELLNEKENTIKKDIPKVLYLNLTVLIISIISLFLIGYHQTLNYLIFVLGILVIILSIIALLSILKIILKTFGIK